MAGLGISGKDGDVKIGATSICEIRKWSFNPKSNNPSYASNKTSGYKRRVPGVKDGSGSLEGAWDPASPAVSVIEVGTEVTLLLYINATQNYSVPSVIDSFKLDVDVDEGEIVSWTADFSTNGAWTNPSASITLPEGVQAPGEDGDSSWQFQPTGEITQEGQPLNAPLVSQSKKKVKEATTAA